MRRIPYDEVVQELVQGYIEDLSLEMNIVLEWNLNHEEPAIRLVHENDETFLEVEE